MSASRKSNKISLITGLIAKLATLELTLRKKQSSCSSSELPKKDFLKKKYKFFFEKFEGINIPESVFPFSSLMLSQVEEKSKGKLKSHELLKIFSGCFFIAFKFIEDELQFFVEDFAKLLGCDQKLIEKMEVGILVHILNFNLDFSGRLEGEMRKLMALG